MAAELEGDGDSIWRALADPTRRRILDLLRDRPRITGDIAANFPVSRIAVMRHLQVLSTVGLVTSRKRGRERWHYLNAVPLQGVHQRWVDAAAEGWASGLLGLRRRVERQGTGMNPDLALDIALEVSIAARPAEVFATLTRDPGGWWGHPYLRPETTGLNLERRLGGLFIETWDGGGAVVATVTGWSEGRSLELSGAFHLGVALGVAVFELSSRDGGTALQFSFRAVGAIETQIADQFAMGWADLVELRLKTVVETGARLGIAPDPPQKEIEP